MSKYNLIDLYEGMSDKEMADAQEADRLEAHPEKDKIKAIQAMMAKEKEGVKENHQSLDPEIASRIEGLLNQPLKKKFLEVGMELIQDVIDEDPFQINDVVSHLANELNAYYDGFEKTGAKLADIPGFENTMDDLDAATKIREDEVEEVSEEKEEMDEAMMPRPSLFKGTEAEVKAYYDSLKREYDRDKEEFKSQYMDFSDEDWKEDFENYVADKALQEHFGRFMKDYQ